MKKVLILSLILFQLSLVAEEINYVCVVDDAMFTKEQGSFSQYAISSKGFDINKTDKTFLHVDGKSFTKTFVHSDDDKTVTYYGAKEPQTLNFGGIHKVYGQESRVYMDKYKLLMYAISDSGGKNKHGWNIVKKRHLLILSVPIRATLMYECMPSKEESKNTPKSK